MPRSRTTFRAGQSGNLSGRPKVVAEIRDLARAHGPAAIRKLAELGGLIKGVRGAESEQCQAAACAALLDRGFGRPAVAETRDGAAGPVVLRVTWAPALPGGGRAASARADRARDGAIARRE